MKKYIVIVFIIQLLTSCSSTGQTAGAPYPSHQNDVYISIEVPPLIKTDTMTLLLYKHVLGYVEGFNTISNKHTQYVKYHALREKDNSFHFKIPDVHQVEYVTIGGEKNTLWGQDNIVPMLDLYMIKPGDSVSLSILWDSSYHADAHLLPCVLSDNKLHHLPEIVRFPFLKYLLQYRFEFSGKGASKYDCRYKLDRIIQVNALNLDTMVSSVDRYKHDMDSLSYQVLKADAIGCYEKSIYRVYHYRNKNDSLRKFEENYFNHAHSYSKITNKAKSLSRYYPYALLVRAYARFSKQAKLRIYSYIKNNYHGELRDKLITLFLLHNQIPDSTGIWKDASRIVKTGYCKKQVERMMKGRVRGMPAYNFALQDTKGKVVRLSDFKGKVVFLDFWFTGCHACSGFYKSTLASIEDEYSGDPNVRFVTISVDFKKNVWINSINSNLYTSPAIINLYTGGYGENCATIKHYHIIGYPQPYIIDKDGRIYTAGLRDKKKIETAIKAALAAK
jgi:thiol-disulfide isomerase/thioredoxin